MQDYYYTKLDYKCLVEDVRKVCVPLLPQLLAEQRRTAEDSRDLYIGEWPTISALSKKYPFIGKRAILISNYKGQMKPIHIDGMGRPLSLNIALQGGHVSNKTYFYNLNDLEVDYETGRGDIYYKLKKSEHPVDSREIRNGLSKASYSLVDDAIICHTMVPHETTNLQDVDRHSICFSLKIPEHTPEHVYNLVNKIQWLAKKHSA